MRPFLPNTILGAFLGFIVGVLGWTGLPFVGLNLPRAGFYVFVMVAVAGGSFIGSLSGPVMRWSAGMAAAVGAIAFALGFAGPLLLEPDSPQGPLLGIFVTGPFGVILGALLGLAIGIVRQVTSSKPAQQSLA
jgi:hypothetical protein